MNLQPIEKLVPSTPATVDELDVHSIFYTIQGEGPFATHTAVFVRLAGCNLRCPGCDTDYTTGRRHLHISQIVHAVKAEAADRTKLVVITGGEPFRQDIFSLCQQLVQEGFAVQIETNGTLAPDQLTQNAFSFIICNEVNLHDYERGVYIVVSPKTGKINEWFKDVACALKYVGDDSSLCPQDGLPLTALGHPAAPHLYRKDFLRYVPIYLQPADEKDLIRNVMNRDAVVRSCLRHGLNVQLQIHKIINVE